MKKILILIFFATFSVIAIANSKNDDRNIEISKNLDIFNSTYKELELFYVDTIKPESTIKYGIDAMLGQLDPYTTYIPESELEKLKFMTTGEYAGIGCVIGKNDEGIYITDVYEGMPAYKNGLKVGDIITKIDGKQTSEMTTTEASEKMKGEAKTMVTFTIKNPISQKEKKVEVQREKIVIPAIQYYDTLSNGVGYININSFTEKSGDKFKEAFLDLKDNYKIKSLVIDLRNNPGGILDEAVEIVNLFVDKKSTVVYTKGKNPDLDEVYKARKEPIDTNIPLFVWVNRNSASASEILAGALQDLDRAVIVGERTFGKGLVQTTRELPYGGSLKVTVAKYYIPSGRCIQSIDYSNRSEEGYVTRIPDSLTSEFKTKNGRIVRDGGGINPDVQIEIKNHATVSYYLYHKNLIFNFVTQYMAKHANIGPAKSFQLSDKDYAEFVEYVKGQNFTYELKTEEGVKALKELIQSEGYLDYAKEEFEALEKKLTHNIDNDLKMFEKEIRNLISIEIVKREHYQKGEFIESLKRDDYREKTEELLSDEKKWKGILTAEKK
ncbi:MAG: S41 family peptidase [Bacteroidales bacterium]|nr:S41 family peptidase [Bacteroidales bacterium]